MTKDHDEGIRAMQKRELKIINRLGLHARAAAQIGHQVSRFQCGVALVFGNRRADARNFLAVMLLAANMGATITVETAGPDESEAMSAITRLVNDRFGEAE
jgi:phosphocarrier protein HPr